MGEHNRIFDVLEGKQPADISEQVSAYINKGFDVEPIGSLVVDTRLERAFYLPIWIIRPEPKPSVSQSWNHYPIAVPGEIDVAQEQALPDESAIDEDYSPRILDHFARWLS